MKKIWRDYYFSKNLIFCSPSPGFTIDLNCSCWPTDTKSLFPSCCVKPISVIVYNPIWMCSSWFGLPPVMVPCMGRDRPILGLKKK